VHYSLHFFAPLAVALIFFKDNWKKAYLVMVATIIVDLDHLLAYPDIFVPNRCSIGFHPLHSYWAIMIYSLLAFTKRFRLISIGLLLHMATDFQDCLWM
jgi:hypothetical protein